MKCFCKPEKGDLLRIDFEILLLLLSLEQHHASACDDTQGGANSEHDLRCNEQMH
jgi:hypothetical protein